MRTSSRFHAVTWLLWALAGAATVQMAPSPVYVALVIAIAALVVEVHRLDTAMARAFPLLVGLGVAFALLRVVLTALTTHGVGHVLFTLPEATLPRLLGGFTVGGTVESPVVLQAASEGFAVVGILAVFGAFNAVISHHELVQATPRAFHEPGLIATVGLAFVPSTMLAIQQTREADLARTGGQRVGRRRMLRQLLPVLESGMERAVNLAESMDSRGFARTRGGPRERAAGWCGLAALLSLGASFLALVGRAPRTAGVLGAVGVVLLLVAIVVASQASRVTRYRPRAMSLQDWLVAGVVWMTPVALVVLERTIHPVLRWITNPPAFPEFSPVVAAAILLLGVPALLAPVRPLSPADAPTPSPGTVRARAAVPAEEAGTR